jgi:hypothetical protein
MSVWKTLLPSALTGTDRAPSWPLPVHGEVGPLLQQLEHSTPDAATRLLQTAAVLAACSAAGARGAAATSPPAPAPEDPAPALTDPARLALLGWALREGPQRLQHLVLQRVADRRWRLPATLLPMALELGRRSVALRPPVTAAIGNRGLWLASQNADWRYAQGAGAEAPIEERWAHGSAEQRRVALAQERRQHPSQARERLAAELPQLSARERADLLSVMADGLTPADEDWLDSLLADRSREVRQVVGGLLLRLPGSGWVQRATHRLSPLLRSERGLLRSTWRLDAPSAADPGWEADGIEPSRPKNDALGERAWWLYQLARQVPVGWWCEHMSCSPADLFAWARKTDWTEALMRAWRDVLAHTAEPDAIDALLEESPLPGLPAGATELAALLPLPRREKHWQRRLAKEPKGLRELLPQLLAACGPGEHLSDAMSNTLAPALQQALTDPNIAYDYALRGALPELCCLLHADVLARLTLPTLRGDETPAHAELLHTVGRVIHARRAFDQLPTAPATR